MSNPGGQVVSSRTLGVAPFRSHQPPVFSLFFDFEPPQLEKSRDDPYFFFHFMNLHAPLHVSSEFDRDRTVIKAVRGFPPFFSKLAQISDFVTFLWGLSTRPPVGRSSSNSRVFFFGVSLRSPVSFVKIGPGKAEIAIPELTSCSRWSSGLAFDTAP